MAMAATAVAVTNATRFQQETGSAGFFCSDQALTAGWISEFHSLVAPRNAVAAEDHRSPRGLHQRRRLSPAAEVVKTTLVDVVTALVKKGALKARLLV